MLFKRPHILKYTIVVSTGSYQDENGDWQPGTKTETVVELECRSEPNGEGQEKPSVNGQEIDFDRVVYLDYEIADIPYGTPVEVFNNGVQLVSGLVKHFERDQKKCRLWV